MRILRIINLSFLLVLLFPFFNLHSQIKDTDTNTVFISYSNEVNGYSVKVTWKPQESRISHIIGPAIIEFSKKDDSVVFYISSNIFGILNSKLPFGSSSGKINTSGHKYITLKYEENATEKDEYFGTGSEPFFFQDIDFDNEKELIISEVGNGQRFYPSYRVYEYNDYAASSYALFEPVYEKPFTLLDGLSEIDYVNKQIVISKSGGACGVEYDYYKFNPSKNISDGGKFVLEKIIELNLDDSTGKCYQYEYKVINQTKQLVSKKEIE